MVFSSYTFLFQFLPWVLIGYYALAAIKSKAPRTIWLTLSSYVFFGWWRPDFLILIWLSTLVDYICGKVVYSSPHEATKKKALWLSIGLNLGLLGYFKYFNFGMESFNAILALLDIAPQEWTKVVLPIGISFYTFQTMSYTIDIYRKEAKPAENLLDMACYVALFPQLVAGPIVRYRDLAEQLVSRVHNMEKFGRGANLFMIGFAKKILLANSAGEISDIAFAAADPGAAASWLGICAYAMQIYYDFSGYSDMAIGLGRMFGFEFPLNFASPYHSKSITEFWRRWHISLSTWLRDYLYIPLGGSHKSKMRTYINLAATMLLGGLWHGAQWTYLVWGAWHGFLLAAERALGKKTPWEFLPRFLQVLITFVLVMIGWVFFRSAGLGVATEFIAGLFGANGWDGALDQIAILPPATLVLAGLALFLTWAGRQSDQIVERAGPISAMAIAVTFGLSVCHMFFQDFNPFLYFQF